MSTLEQTGGYYTPEQLNPMAHYHLEMLQGAKSKMYTLRTVPSPTHPRPWIAKEVHITNLSTDKNNAWDKAVVYANSMKMELYDGSMDELNKIVRVSDGYVNFGKNDGKHVSVLEDSYLIWLAEGSKISAHDEEGNYYTKTYACDVLVGHAVAEAEKRGLFVEFEGKKMSCRKRDYILEQRTGRGFHHENGEKVEMILFVEKSRSFLSSFGYNQYTYIYELKNLETGKRYRYMGSIDRHTKGDTIHITGTIKHDEYNGDQITYIKNMKDVPNEVYKNYKKLKAGQILEDVNGLQFEIVEMPEDLHYGKTFVKDITGDESIIYREDFKKYGWKIVK